MVNKNEFELVVEQYYKMFGEYFPLMDVQDWGDERIIKTIKKHIKSGKPYDPVYPDGCKI